MAKFELTKNFRFESAHRLGKGYPGKCKNLHGHSWNGVLTVGVDSLDEYDMAVDFGVLGKFLKAVEERFDHKTIVGESDYALQHFLDSCGNEYVLVKGNPTCEVIAEDIFHWAETFLDNCQVISVTIKETCTTSCTF